MKVTPKKKKKKKTYRDKYTLAVTINVLHNRDYKEMQDEMELQKTRRNKTIKNVVVATKQGRDVYERQLLRHSFMVFQSDLALEDTVAQS
jgi:hypothetical protein